MKPNPIINSEKAEILLKQTENPRHQRHHLNPKSRQCSCNLGKESENSKRGFGCCRESDIVGRPWWY